MSRRRAVAEQQREVAGWRASGLSAVRYATRRGYSAGSLLRWARVDTSVRGSTAPAFVRLELAPAAASAPLVVEAGQGRVIVPRGFDPAHLRAVIAALAEAEA
jgi:hypothetical protein